jgi:hypothetical protein
MLAVLALALLTLPVAVAVLALLVQTQHQPLGVTVVSGFSLQLLERPLTTLAAVAVRRTASLQTGLAVQAEEVAAVVVVVVVAPLQSRVRQTPAVVVGATAFHL